MNNPVVKAVSKRKSSKKKSSVKKGSKNRSPSKTKQKTPEDIEDTSAIQIDLKVLRFQERAEEIALDNEDLKKNLKTVIKGDKETITFLEETVKRCEIQIQELNDKVLLLSTELSTEKKQNLSNIQAAEESFNQKLSVFKAENEVLRAKCQSLEEFTVERQQLVNEISRLESEVTRLTNQDTEEMKSTCREAICDKQKLKDEMQTKLDELAEEHKNHIKMKVAEEYKQTVLDNKRMLKQIETLTNQLTAMFAENQQLKASVEAEKLEIREFQKSHEKLFNSAMAHKDCQKQLKLNDAKLTELSKTIAQLGKTKDKQQNESEAKIKELTEQLDTAKSIIVALEQAESKMVAGERQSKLISTIQLQLEEIVEQMGLVDQSLATDERQLICSKLAALLSTISGD